MGFFSKMRQRLSGKRSLRRAHIAEAEGRLEDAVVHYLEAGQKGEAARIFALRADAALRPMECFQLLGQALSLAEGSTVTEVLKRRASLALELHRSKGARSVPRRDAPLCRELPKS